MVEWIIGLAASIIVAVVGWTLAASLASRVRMFAKVEQDLLRLEAVVQANSTRVSVLENQHNTVMASLARIEGLLMEHIRLRP